MSFQYLISVKNAKDNKLEKVFHIQLGWRRVGGGGGVIVKQKNWPIGKQSGKVSTRPKVFIESLGEANLIVSPWKSNNAKC